MSPRTRRFARAAFAKLLPRSICTAALLACVGVASAGANDPFADADAIDELGVARVAEEAGDVTLRAYLLEPVPRQRALIAVRASVHARAPEALLEPLAKLACGRDPALAPEAARASYEIASRLAVDELSAREVLRGDLGAARTALQCVEEKPPPRADIVALLTQVRAALDVLLR
ncbi:MAG: hypothetical protein JWN04_839 [Myxococcaceae bacterium]|nr:hypothetical protein [Myxococcaceae bacterium]